MSMMLTAKAMGIKTGSPLRKLVLLKLADNANDQGESWPSIPYIAKECEMSERSVQNHIKELIKIGLVWVESRKSNNGINKSNVYHLTLDNRDKPTGANPAPVSGANPAPRTSHSFEPVIDPDKPPLPPTEVSEPVITAKKQKISTPYQAVMEAYNEAVCDKLPSAETLNDKRKRAIKRLLSELKTPTAEAASAYFNAFVDTAGKFYFGENDRGWRANFDYLLRPETLLKVREGAL